MKIQHKESALARRAAAYPPITDQLDAIFKLAEALREQGVKMPQEVDDWVDQCRKVKDTYQPR